MPGLEGELPAATHPTHTGGGLWEEIINNMIVDLVELSTTEYLYELSLYACVAIG